MNPEEFSNLLKVKKLVSCWIQNMQALVLSTTLSCVLQKNKNTSEELWLKHFKIP